MSDKCSNYLCVLDTSYICEKLLKKHEHILYNPKDKGFYIYIDDKTFRLNPKIKNADEEGIELVMPRTCCSVPIKRLVPGDGIELTDTGTQVRIRQDNAISGKITTVDNLPGLLFEIPLEEKSAIALSLIIIGSRIRTGESQSFFMNKMFKRLNNVISENSMPDDSTLNDIGGRKVLFNFTQSSVRVYVQGISGESVSWSGNAKFSEVFF